LTHQGRVSSRGLLYAYSPFYALIFEVVSSSARIRMLGIFIYVWGTIEFTLMMYMRFHVWLFVVWDVISAVTWYFMLEFNMCWKWIVTPWYVLLNCRIILLEIICGVQGCYKNNFKNWLVISIQLNGIQEVFDH